MEQRHLEVLFNALNFAQKRNIKNGNGLDDAPGPTTSLDTALEEFRMAITNLPLTNERIVSSHQSLLEALRHNLGADIITHEVLQSLALSEPNTSSPPLLAQEQPREHSSVEAPAGATTRLSTLIRRKPSSSTGSSASYRSKSCYVQQEMQAVLPRLFLGSYHPAADRSILDASGITHICCCIDVSPRFPKCYAYLTLPASDDADFDMSQYFDRSFTFIDDALSNGGAVLVHCGAGISRAPTITAAYMMRKLKITASEAIRHIKSIRSCASPNRGFTHQLQNLEKQVT